MFKVSEKDFRYRALEDSREEMSAKSKLGPIAICSHKEKQGRFKCRLMKSTDETESYHSISTAVQTVISDNCREAAFSYSPRWRE